MATHRQTLLEFQLQLPQKLGVVEENVKCRRVGCGDRVVTKSGPAEAESSLKTKVNPIREIVIRTKQKCSNLPE